MINYKIVSSFVLYFLIYSSAFGQQIKFEVYLKDRCVDTISKLMFFNLNKGDKDFYPKNNNGIVMLKEKGKYELTTIYNDDKIIYELNDFKSVVDTIQKPIIRKCLEPTSSPNFVGYCCCNSKCEGKQIDYYSNGNKRLEGNFIDGKPMGKLKFYNSEGTLIRVDKYNRKGVMTRQKIYKEKTCND